MNPKNRGNTIAFMLMALGGESVDSIIDRVLDPRCTKCGHKVNSASDLFTKDNICAPCVVGAKWKEETP